MDISSRFTPTVARFELSTLGLLESYSINFNTATNQHNNKRFGPEVNFMLNGTQTLTA